MTLTGTVGTKPLAAKRKSHFDSLSFAYLQRKKRNTNRVFLFLLCENVKLKRNRHQATPETAKSSKTSDKNA